jgi:propanol-preferring alcohol dehydrogenase
VNLARSSLIDTHVETFALDEAPRAYELLDEGKITGRAVVLPNG